MLTWTWLWLHVDATHAHARIHEKQHMSTVRVCTEIRIHVVLLHKIWFRMLASTSLGDTPQQPVSAKRVDRRSGSVISREMAKPSAPLQLQSNSWLRKSHSSLDLSNDLCPRRVRCYAKLHAALCTMIAHPTFAIHCWFSCVLAQLEFVGPLISSKMSLASTRSKMLWKTCWLPH